LQNFLAQTNLKYKLDSGDNVRTQQVLSAQDFGQILDYCEGYALIAIDEAQGIPNIGMALKIMVDQIPGIQVIATGSSSFDLAGQVGEPLTGRKRTLTLYPISQMELMWLYNRQELRQHLEEYLVYGSYPEVIQAASLKAKAEIISEIANAYLLKDILAFERVRSSKTLLNLLQLLAFQIGSEVSLNELATQIGVDVKTIQRHLDLLEKTFVIYRLGGFSRNLRQEITNKAKYYFFDNGIRNALIAQFNRLDQRNDAGLLWENFCMIERIKQRTYIPIYGNAFFWRTYARQEIDLVEEREGRLFGYELKWSENRPVFPPKDWLKGYPGAEFTVVNPSNYLDFLLAE
jgi:predicted AAA+ superfamily ATPase